MAGADEDDVRHVRVRSVNSLLVCLAVLAFSALQPPGLRGAASPAPLAWDGAGAVRQTVKTAVTSVFGGVSAAAQLAEQALHTCPAAIAQLAGASSYGGARPHAQLAHKVQAPRRCRRGTPFTGSTNYKLPL